ncbi:SDR family NAD(P)-dependent oxidoreductase [Pseudonocardia broussonetiae]|uniref:SDR family NAD(P)-dependent oxidoreductase n=1 Tax=Pseudonocardia broussonetiae TaxID=2736640 RepID=A0A6M6JSJ3_9PSEU|nr:SDR family NAD(P)-dependent oxidoreductase [Pseudonocardia broussonetiae]QJY49997.1 SDR family NAD(P)-dependent oxidoreductase [Pseudonocardia broussonetiae]
MTSPDRAPSFRPLALVTGASNGIGLEIARELARRGYDLVVTGRSGRTDEVAAELRRLGVQAHPVRADLADYDAVESLWASTLAVGRPLELAVLNAGIAVGGAFADIDLADDLHLIDVNVKSVVHLAKRVVVDMIPRGRGRILMTSSVSATQPTPYETTYGPSRAFVYMFAESLRAEVAEVAEHGITVTALLPGATDSDFHARAGMQDTKFGDNSWKNDKREVARQGVEAVLAGRDAVVGGNRATKFAVLRNRFLPERVKAARHARDARPSRSAPPSATCTTAAPTSSPSPRLPGPAPGATEPR